MITDDLARELRETGLAWQPAPGDRFRIEAEALSEEIFILSHIVIEARTYPTGTVLAFNGTTEWALDSVSKDKALWLPREDQLRAYLGGTFAGLHPVEGGYCVRTTRPAIGGESDGPAAEFTATDPEDAYAKALLDLLRRAMD